MRQTILHAAATSLFIAALATAAQSQSPASAAGVAQSSQPDPQTVAKQEAKVSGGLFSIEEMRGQLSEQREEIEELRAALREQARLVGELRTRVEQTERQVAADQHSTPAVVRDANYATPGAPGALTTAASATAAQDSKLEA